MRDKRFKINVTPSFRIEFFSRSHAAVNTTHPAVRMGYFRVKRSDNELGGRWFVTDVREVINDELADNAIIVYREFELDLLDAFEVEPAYVNFDLAIYRFGTYNCAGAEYSIRIDHDGVNVVR